MKSVQLGRIAGVPIKGDATLLIVLPLLAFWIGTNVPFWVSLLNEQFAATIPPELLATPLHAYAIGVAAAVGLFMTVLAHELGHTVVAKRLNYRITGITLWLLGGLTNLRALPRNWRDEFAIAAGGPFVSLVIGVLFFGAFRTLPTMVHPGNSVLAVSAAFLCGFLAITNLSLVLLNMLPGFPLDGGRIVRALLSIAVPYDRATHYVVELGKLHALILAIAGVLTGLNLGLVAIAFVIYLGATAEDGRTTVAAGFDGLTVGDLMRRGDAVATIGQERTLTELFDRIYAERQTAFPVVDDGALVGLVTLEATPTADEFERERLLVRDVMDRSPHTISPDTAASHALRSLQLSSLDLLLVVDDGAFAGVLSRTDLMDAIEVAGDDTSVTTPITELRPW